MNIYMIWAHDPITGSKWIVDAWDEDTISENASGWYEAQVEAVETHGFQNVRTMSSTIDMDAVHAAFDPPHASCTTPEATE